MVRRWERGFGRLGGLAMFGIFGLTEFCQAERETEKERKLGFPLSFHFGIQAFALGYGMVHHVMPKDPFLAHTEPASTSE